MRQKLLPSPGLWLAILWLTPGPAFAQMLASADQLNPNKTSETNQSQIGPTFIRMQAAEIIISGTVTSEKGEPLVGVSILVKGTSTGTTTDASGHYTLSVPDNGKILVFSYIGFLTKEVPISNTTVLDVTLSGDAEALDEVVVVGYGTVKKSDLTGSISSVSSEEIKAFPAANVMQALSGRAAGVQVKQNNGAPGGGISVRIRGTNSIVGNNEPLYVVDGFPVSSPQTINNSSIKSIEVLKDASAIAIYGSRGIQWRGVDYHQPGNHG